MNRAQEQIAKRTSQQIGDAPLRQGRQHRAGAAALAFSACRGFEVRDTDPLRTARQHENLRDLVGVLGSTLRDTEISLYLFPLVDRVLDVPNSCAESVPDIRLRPQNC